MDIKAEIDGIVVVLGKSENMRITAGKRFQVVINYMTTPGTDGAQQVIDLGQEPTHRGVWNLIVDHPKYPVQLGTSYDAGRRMLGIAKAEDPEAAEKDAAANATKARRERAQRATSVTEVGGAAQYCNNGDQASLEAVVAAVKLLSIDDFARFKVWFREYCGA